MPPQEWAYEAGRNEAAGRVREPRHRESRGPQDHPHVGEREKPTACRGRKAAVLDASRRVSRTPPGAESGAGVHRGDAGTWESQWSPWVIAGVGVPTDAGKTPGVARRRPPRPRAVHKPGPQSQRRDPRHRGRQGSPERPPRWAMGRLRGAEYRRRGAGRSESGRWGPAVPGTHGREGDAGQHVFWEALWESRRAHHPYPGNSRAWPHRPSALRRWCTSPG